MAKKIFKTRSEVILMRGPGFLGLELGLLSVAEPGYRPLHVRRALDPYNVQTTECRDLGETFSEEAVYNRYDFLGGLTQRI
mgnify:CR=1 FL=1